MNYLKKLALSFFLTVLTTMLLTACSPQEKSKIILADKKTRDLKCIALQSHCQFDLASGQVQVLFDVDKIVAEQSFNMVLNYRGAKTLTKISGYLEGVDMFMGKIPLFIDSLAPEAFFSDQALNDQALNDKTLVNSTLPTKALAQMKRENQQMFQAEVLVGSCSAEQMIWRIWLSFSFSDNQTYSKMLTVVSYRS